MQISLFNNTYFFHFQHLVFTLLRIETRIWPLYFILLFASLVKSTRSFHPSFLSFLLASWRAVRSYWSHLEGRDPFEAMTVRTAPSSGGLLAEVFVGFYSDARQMPGGLCTAPRIISLSPLSLATDVTSATLGASDLWLGERAGAGGTATLA